MTRQTITTCDCGQRNRLPVSLPPGKMAVCGSCHEPLDDDDDEDDTDDDDDDEDGE